MRTKGDYIIPSPALVKVELSNNGIPVRSGLVLQPVVMDSRSEFTLMDWTKGLCAGGNEG